MLYENDLKELEVFLYKTSGKVNKIGIKAAKSAFARFASEFFDWAGGSSSRNKDDFDSSLKSYKNSNGNVCFIFHYSSFSFTLSQDVSSPLQMVIACKDPLYCGLNGSFEFKVVDFTLTWDAIYMQLKDAIHVEWRNIADSLKCIDKGFHYRRAVSSVDLKRFYTGGKISTTLSKMDESEGIANPYELKRIFTDLGADRKYVVFSSGSSEKFKEFCSVYEGLQVIEHYDKDGVRYYRFSARKNGEPLTFSVGQKNECNEGLWIKDLLVHDFYGDGDVSDWKRQYDKWVIEVYENLFLKRPDKILDI